MVLIKYYLCYLAQRYILLQLLLVIAANSNALTFTLQPNSDIVGHLQTVTVQPGESLADIGHAFDMGITEMIEANANIDPWHPKVGSKVIIPSQFILPPGDRNGIVINLAEMRLYFYHPDKTLITTHPIGIGKKNTQTPLANGFVTQKITDPYWYPPASIRAEHALKGKTLPKVVLPGPNNPLGKFALRLSIPGYLIHGTNRPGGIGLRSSNGCIRMFPEDIESLFNLVPIKTKVRIIHVTQKSGSHLGEQYIEVHTPLSEHQTTYSNSRDMPYHNHGYPIRLNEI